MKRLVVESDSFELVIDALMHRESLKGCKNKIIHKIGIQMKRNELTETFITFQSEQPLIINSININPWTAEIFEY